MVRTLDLILVIGVQEDNINKNSEVNFEIFQIILGKKGLYVSKPVYLAYIFSIYLVTITLYQNQFFQMKI